MKKNCKTCKYEPEWEERPSGMRRGHCRFSYKAFEKAKNEVPACVFMHVNFIDRYVNGRLSFSNDCPVWEAKNEILEKAEKKKPKDTKMNEWLEKRKFICRRCEFDDEYCTERANIRPEQWFCPKFRPKEMWEDDLSASMFEARVAAKLAEYCANYWQYQSAWHALKQARIEVEQEFYK